MTLLRRHHFQFLIDLFEQLGEFLYFHLRYSSTIAFHPCNDHIIGAKLKLPKPTAFCLEWLPRHAYTKLTVKCRSERREYSPAHIRQAVEYLKTVEPAPPDALPWQKVGLQARTGTLPAGDYKLKTTVFLTLDQIVGKTPREVWEMFDLQVDDDINGLLKRQHGFVKIK